MSIEDGCQKDWNDTVYAGKMGKSKPDELKSGDTVTFEHVIEMGMVGRNTGSHYKGKQGDDLIAHWQRTNCPTVARAKQVAQIERYCSRYGEKDKPLVEARKMLDYATRLVEYEESLL